MGNEQEILDVFNKEFEVNVRHERNKWSVIDGFDHDNKVAVEVKDRTIHKDRYDKSVMGLNKYVDGKRNILTISFFL
jgi:hypothetical protein